MLLDMLAPSCTRWRWNWASSHHRVGTVSDISKSKEYHDRIEAINFSLAHDDGQTNHDLAGADVILVGGAAAAKPHQPVPGHAARPEGGQLPADPRRL